MPFCPKCRDEFREWAKICSNCGAVLVDKLPELSISKPILDKDPLAHIATAPNEPIAMMWAEILENNDIRSLIKRQQDLVLAMQVPFAFSHCEIHVLASQAEKAKEILAPS